jgi:hypothetical protein
MHTFVILCILYYSLNSMFTIYKFLFTLFTGVLTFINKALSGKQFLFIFVYYCLHFISEISLTNTIRPISEVQS